MQNLTFNDKLSFLVGSFIRKENISNWTQKDWIRERMAVSQLCKKYPDFHFFYSLTDLYGKFNSLLGLLYNKYNELDERYQNYEKHKVKEFKLDYQLLVF